MAATTELPPEILTDIFTRLPVTSIGKCRCLSKPWSSLLSTPQFIKSHLNRKPYHESLLLVSPSHSIHTITDARYADVSTKLELLGDWSEVVGSCNGLVLLVNDEEEKFLVNPVTLEQVEIGESPQALDRDESFRMYGFGYDSCSDDYKIVTLSYNDTFNEHEPDCVDTFVDVYSVKRGSWRRVDSSPYDHAVPEIWPGAFVNGAIHWLASSREPGFYSVIAAFDLADEAFRQLPAPIGVDVEKFVFNKLVVLGGCLCMFDGRVDFWVMKEYGLAESWTKFSISAHYDWDFVKPLCFVGSEDEVEDQDVVVLLTEGETLVAFHQKEGMLRDMVVDGGPATFIDAVTFVESLVSPAFNNT